jgi:peptidoglycan/LPS O-acetylase OafA/YrhL
MRATTEPAIGPRKNYFCLQALRAVAAALVVVHHSITMWLDGVIRRPGATQWSNGAAGVDIFFVISGFVMAISLPGLAGKPNKAGLFLWRRLTRIVPLYWAAITLSIAGTEMSPASAVKAALTPWRIACSYFFIPSRDAAGKMFPIVGVGWTLNYEMFFYLLFAAALALNISPLAFLTPCLTAIALLGVARTPAWPDFTSLASPVVIEFLFGLILARLAMRRQLPGKIRAALLLGGGFLALLLAPEPHWPWGFLVRGLPAAAIVAGAVALEGELGGRLPKWLLEAGDASYALYLSHTFLLPCLDNAMKILHITGTPALVAAIVLGLGVSFPVAVLIHRYVEKPLMNSFKKRRVEGGKIEIRSPKPETLDPLAPVTVAEA